MRYYSIFHSLVRISYNLKSQMPLLGGNNCTLYSERHKINKLPTLKLLKGNMKSPGMHAKLIQLCLTVCDPMHCSPLLSILLMFRKMSIFPPGLRTGNDINEFKEEIPKKKEDWLLSLWDSPGKNTGVGCQALLHGVFWTQGSNPCLIISPAS